MSGRKKPAPSGHIAPVAAWCPVDDAGVLQVQHVQYCRHHIMPPAGANWRFVRVVVTPAPEWAAMKAAQRAIDALPDCVACAVLGGQEDPRTAQEAA